MAQPEEVSTPQQDQAGTALYGLRQQVFNLQPQLALFGGRARHCGLVDCEIGRVRGCRERGFCAKMASSGPRSSFPRRLETLVKTGVYTDLIAPGDPLLRGDDDVFSPVGGLSRQPP